MPINPRKYLSLKKSICYNGRLNGMAKCPATIVFYLGFINMNSYLIFIENFYMESASVGRNYLATYFCFRVKCRCNYKVD